MKRLPLIEVGFSVHLGDGSAPFGAVRKGGIYEGRPGLLVYVEGGGDFVVPLTAIEKVVEKRVVLRFPEVSPEMQEAIRHAVDQEDVTTGEEEVELVSPHDLAEPAHAQPSFIAHSIPVQALVDTPGTEEELKEFDEEESFAPRYDLRPDSPPDEFPGRDVGSRYGAPPSVTSPRGHAPTTTRRPK